MRLKIKGGNQYKVKLIRAMCRWFGKTQLSKPTNLLLKIRINIKKLETDLGNTLVTDNILKRPKYFNIELDSKLKLEELKWTLAHELWHVRQYTMNHLYDYQTINAIRFKGNVYPCDKTDDMIKYLTSEWEIEARGMEQALVIQFENFMKEKA